MVNCCSGSYGGRWYKSWEYIFHLAEAKNPCGDFAGINCKFSSLAQFCLYKIQMVTRQYPTRTMIIRTKNPVLVIINFPHPCPATGVHLSVLLHMKRSAYLSKEILILLYSDQ